MNKTNVTITPFEVMILVHKTYEFLFSQSKMTDDDIKLVTMTISDIIEKNKILKS